MAEMRLFQKQWQLSSWPATKAEAHKERFRHFLTHSDETLAFSCFSVPVWHVGYKHIATGAEHLTIRLHKGDLPDLSKYGDSVAIDSETLGLNPLRDRLCVVQLSPGDGSADIVQIAKGQTSAPNIEKLLADKDVVKMYHFGRFDIAVLYHSFGVLSANNYCTKIASRLTRTYTDRHGLKDLCREMIGVELSKIQQSSDWAAEKLSDAQQAYAASDVLYLHQLKEKLDARLAREERTGIAQACFDFLPQRCLLDLAGWDEEDIFAHS